MTFSEKKTLVATSSNHAEVIPLQETGGECVWLRSISQHIQSSSRISVSLEPTVLYEDNAACLVRTKKDISKVT